METMLDIFEQAGFDRNHAQSPAVDGGAFDNVFGVVRTALRALYPARLDITTLTGPPLKDNQPPATYIHTQLRRWRLITERDVRVDPIMTTLFRKAIREGMSQEVGRRLDEVVGLNTMTHRAFVDHVVHAVERQRKEGKKLEDQTKDIQRKLLQLQLEELKAKEKKAREIKELDKEKEAKKVASVKIQNMDNGFFDFEATPPHEPWSSLMVPQPTVIYNFSGIPHPVAMQGNMKGGGGAQPGGNQIGGGPGNGGQNNQWKGQQNQNNNIQNRNWNQQGFPNQQRQGPIVCYGCGQEGHIKRRCPNAQGMYPGNQGTWVPNQPQQSQGYPNWAPPPQARPSYQSGGPVNYQGAQ
ncbi:uncharacterized protein LOC135254971 isoform X1 [Anguilla rostrata]|uniref:uncharacterized protein LOC135254971 isoform X1 n=1 Tax=Anguilla rostrata TaxID=7938 RepID=UPI0030D3E734